VGLSICRKDVVELLTDDRWIVLCFFSGFSHYLEQCHFTPGTLKNEEFEIIVAPVVLAQSLGHGKSRCFLQVAFL
jgi:hypothetical protein